MSVSESLAEATTVEVEVNKEATESSVEDTRTDMEVNTDINVTEPEAPLTPLKHLHSLLALPNKAWCDQSPDDINKIHISKLSEASSSTQSSVVTHTLTVHEDLSWTLFVNHHKIEPATCSALASFPSALNSRTLNRLLSSLDQLPVCSGQPDPDFVHMVTDKKGKILSPKGAVVAYVDDTPVELHQAVYSKTVRTTDCEIICHSVTCLSCKKYRSTLRSMHHRLKKQTKPSKYTNDRYLNTPEKVEKISSLRKRALTAEHNVSKLRERICKLTQDDSETVDKDLESDLLDIMRENDEKVKASHPEGSFTRIFWEEQLKAASVGNMKQIRWHPVMIKFCLNLKLLSTSAYHSLRTSGFMKLPSERTLRDYTHHFVSKAGFQEEVDDQLLAEIKQLNLPDSRRYVAILIDEMKIKEGLVYNKYSGEIIGFTKLSDVNDQLNRLEQGDSSPVIAKQVLVVMVRGIMCKLEFPYAHFGSCGVTADYLYPIIWETVRRLEANEIKVICLTADGASCNRKLFRMHYDEKDPSTFKYKARNPYASDYRWLYFISDPPHLLKTVRNCWSHSGIDGTRRMQV